MIVSIESIEMTISIVERLIVAARDRGVRNVLVARLATLDRRLAALRNVPE